MKHIFVPLIAHSLYPAPGFFLLLIGGGMLILGWLCSCVSLTFALNKKYTYASFFSWAGIVWSAAVIAFLLASGGDKTSQSPAQGISETQVVAAIEFVPVLICIASLCVIRYKKNLAGSSK